MDTNISSEDPRQKRVTEEEIDLFVDRLNHTITRLQMECQTFEKEAKFHRSQTEKFMAIRNALRIIPK